MNELVEKLRELESRSTAYGIALQIIAETVGPRCQAALLQAARDASSLALRIAEDERQLETFRETLRRLAEPPQAA